MKKFQRIQTQMSSSYSRNLLGRKSFSKELIPTSLCFSTFLKQSVEIPKRTSKIFDSQTTKLHLSQTRFSKNQQYLFATISSESPKYDFSRIQDLAQKGNPEAQFELGHAYEHGQNVERNIEKAIIWYEKAAVANFAPALLWMSLIYRNGEYVERDLKRSIQVNAFVNDVLVF